MIIWQRAALSSLELVRLQLDAAPQDHLVVFANQLINSLTSKCSKECLDWASVWFEDHDQVWKADTANALKQFIDDVIRTQDDWLLHDVMSTQNDWLLRESRWEEFVTLTQLAGTSCSNWAARIRQYERHLNLGKDYILVAQFKRGLASSALREKLSDIEYKTLKEVERAAEVFEKSIK